MGLLTGEEIVQDVQDEHHVTPDVDSSDDDEPSPQLCPKPSFAELRMSIDTAELYLSYDEGNQSYEMYSLIQRIQTLILSNPPKQRQTNIKYYFES